MIKNIDIRQAAKAANIKLWEIADECGYSDVAFSKKMRHELSIDEKKNIFTVIQRLTNNRR